MINIRLSLIPALLISALTLTPATIHAADSEASQNITIEELQQLLQQFDPTMLQQMLDSLNAETEQLQQEADNYLQCLEQQQAITPSEPIDLSSFISEALTTGKVCQFLLDDLVNKMHPKPEPESDNNKQLLEESL